MSFNDYLKQAWEQQNSLVCVGLDPDTKRIPKSLGSGHAAILRFNKAIIDATAEAACCFKPQIAYYAALGAESVLERTIDYIKCLYPQLPVILDAKRGDIGATAHMYAKEAFERYGADAVTVNPYMGFDTIEPYLEFTGKGVVVLCRTSNPGSAQLQALSHDGVSIAEHVARIAATHDCRDQLSLVVGATYPQELKTIRQCVGDLPLLVPGVGAQGGDVNAVMANGADSQGTGLMINSSRAILYASDGVDFAQAAANEALALRDQINACRERHDH